MDSIKRRDFIKKSAVGVAGAAGAGTLAACGGDGGGVELGVSTAEAAAVQGPEISWRLATSFPPSLDILHGGADRLAEKISALTGGRFSIRVYAAGEIVPALQVMDAVMQGTVQCGLTAGYYYIGKHPALAFDSALPFGFNSRQNMAWMYHGGGIELLREIYAQFGVIHFPMSNTGAQMGGWFRDRVDSLADLQGLRMRIPGIGGEIMSRLGVSVQVLGAPDIYPALERGAIDATEWVGAHDDLKLGFYQVAPYYYMPGWWEPGPNLSLQISMDAWNELPPSYQTMLEVCCQQANTDTLALYDAANPIALETLVNEHGVQLRTFSDDILEAAWSETQAYQEEQAADNADFSRILDSFKSFRERSFPYFAGNEMTFANFAFPKILSALSG